MVGKHEYMNMGPRIYRVCYATGRTRSAFSMLVEIAVCLLIVY